MGSLSTSVYGTRTVHVALIADAGLFGVTVAVGAVGAVFPIVTEPEATGDPTPPLPSSGQISQVSTSFDPNCGDEI